MDIVQQFTAQVSAAEQDLPGPELLPERLARACTAVLPIDGAGLSVRCGGQFRLLGFLRSGLRLGCLRLLFRREIIGRLRRPRLARKLGQPGANAVQLRDVLHAQVGGELLQGVLACDYYGLRIGAQEVADLLRAHAAAQREIEQGAAGRVELAQRLAKGVRGQA